MEINKEWKTKFFKHYFKEKISSENIRKCLIYKNNHLDKPLYHYTKVKHIEDIVCENLMYLRKINELNDPFEGDLLADVEFEKIENGQIVKYTLDWEAVKEHVSIACFSERHDINPMWAHYADNHKGICVGYKFNNANLKIRDACFPIYYVNKTNNDLVSKNIVEDFKAENRLLSEIFLKKGKSWCYEKEWRVIIPSNLHSDEITFKWKNHKRYLNFIKPISVYLGYKTSDDDKKYIGEMCNDYGIKTYEMVKDTSGYNLIAREYSF